MGSLRLGLRVQDVEAAADFYGGLGFDPIGTVPGPEGHPLLAILHNEDAMLICDALVGLPFPDSDRERRTQEGPRGLGVVIGLTVDDLEVAYDYCVDRGCEITSEPRDEPWGERVFSCVDPFGYEWEIGVPIEEVEDATEAVREQWFGA
jgi:uncharacterized glyoxalase superfamily protein PhnB